MTSGRVGTGRVVAVLERGEDAQVTAAAMALGLLLGAEPESVQPGPGSAAEQVAAVLRAVDDEDAVAVAMSAHGEHPLCWEVMTRVRVPLMVVPRAAVRTAGRLARVLLPLDGAPSTAAGVDHLVRTALDAGAEVVAVHVFDASNVPAFWDHGTRTRTEWAHEFLRRNLPREVRLDLRRGDPAHEVLAEVERQDADLVLVGWGQDLAAGRAATVREALSTCPVPVLLVGNEPSPGAPGPGTFADEGTGPSTLHDDRGEG